MEDNAVLNKKTAMRFMKDNESIFLSGYTSLDDAAAETLASYEGDLRLGGLNNISDSSAESLSFHRGKLFLSGLAELSDAAAKSLGNHAGGLNLWGLRNLSDAAAVSLCKNISDLDIDFEKLNRSTAAIFKRQLSLINEDMSPQEKDTVLTKDVAEQFLRDNESVFLSNYTFIQYAAAQILSRHDGELYLWGLTSISENSADVLASHRGDLNLGGLTHLSDKAATSLSHHKGALFVRLSTISPSAATILRNHRSLHHLP